MIVVDRLSVQRRFSWKKWPKRAFVKIDTIVVHRNSVGLDAESVADWYQENPRWAGPRMPYHFIITKHGAIEQALQLEVRGNHARGRNTRSIGIAVVGDFRKHPATPRQTESLRQLLIALERWIDGARIQRHRAYGVYDCPGKWLPLEKIAEQVRQQTSVSNETIKLSEMGVRL